MLAGRILWHNARSFIAPSRRIALTRSYATGDQLGREQVEVIKQLRRLTRGGIVECKAALRRCNWDLDSAIKHIRQIQQSSEFDIDTDKQLFGKIALPKDITGERKAVIVELSCNCDFVTSSKEFAQLSHDVRNRIQKAVDSNDITSEHLSDGCGFRSLNVDIGNDLVYEPDNGTTLGQVLQRVSAEYKRKVILSNIVVYQGMPRVDHTGLYVHHKLDLAGSMIGDRLGIVTVRSQPKGSGDHSTIDNTLRQIAKCLALQIVANPLAGETAQHGVKQREVIMDIKDVLVETWLQPDVVRKHIHDLCDVSGVSAPKLGDNITIGDTLHCIEECIGSSHLTVPNALCMRIGNKPILYRQ
ncbi:elongation factor Ts [Babesia ovis]|uniref:Elongation factor Ts n=1 Tax=Babesia ovis TaxID=5869 RepID=A0A9W5WU70_BABOV|nr:elongation factor Ts [Babesia ovis]